MAMLGGRGSVQNRTYSALIPLISLALLGVACGTSNVASARTPSPQSSPSPSPSPSATSNPTVSSKVFVLAPNAGSGVGGTVKVESAANGATLTMQVTGLGAGQSYLADADPLPCLLFTGGPSQSFPKTFTTDGSGNATVVWTVPSGMDSNANVQVLRSGQFVVLACADLR